MRYLEHWAHRLFPKMPFDEVLERIERLGTKRDVQVGLFPSCASLSKLSLLFHVRAVLWDLICLVTLDERGRERRCNEREVERACKQACMHWKELERARERESRRERERERARETDRAREREREICNDRPMSPAAKA